MRVRSNNGNVQGFDTKWDEVLFSMTKVSDEAKMETLCKKQLHNSEELKLVMAWYLQDTVQNGDAAERNGSAVC